MNAIGEEVLARLRTGALAGATRLDLRDAALTRVPIEILALADTLEVLDLSRNALEQLPDDLHRLHRLRVIFCSDNRFTQLPSVLGRCPNLEMVGFKANRIDTVPPEALPPRLRWLILTDNAIEALPETIGRCAQLEKLMLAGNRLRALPTALADCQALGLLRIAANRFEALPELLPRLPQLAWLAMAGNPMSATREAAVLADRSVPVAKWSDLALHERVGEGASGVIHRATWTPPGSAARTVALKLFKGSVTSDGWPRSELAAQLAAGAHPQRIGVEARLGGHPAGTDGLAMAWVDAAFANLAGPPSLASCTRDVYADALRFTPAQALGLLRGVAAAVADLHGRGILHSDLYAHNLLWRDDGEVRLGDFGAAAFTDALPAAQAGALQRMEALAFGHLLEEVRLRCTGGEPALSAGLKAIEARCRAADPAARPAFADIARALAPW